MGTNELKRWHGSRRATVFLRKKQTPLPANRGGVLFSWYALIFNGAIGSGLVSVLDMALRCLRSLARIIQDLSPFGPSVLLCLLFVRSGERTTYRRRAGSRSQLGSKIFC